MTLNGIFLSKEKKKELEKELEKLVTHGRKEMAEKLAKARELALSDDEEEFILTIEEKHKLEDRIVEIRNVLFKARVTKKECRVLADVGSEVVVAHKETVIVFKLVSSVEVDPSKNKVSVKSKVGKKLQGLRVGKKVKLPNAKGKEIEYRVLYVC
ncbi:GreA/GreB family elongation factor [bacterium]|nr:GreA/GreB family elongation factor [bacterium]